jgi:hypothetical protein
MIIESELLTSLIIKNKRTLIKAVLTKHKYTVGKTLSYLSVAVGDENSYHCSLNGRKIKYA